MGGQLSLYNNQPKTLEKLKEEEVVNLCTLPAVLNEFIQLMMTI